MDKPQDTTESSPEHPDGFYPFRIQQESQPSEVPVIEHHDDIHKLNETVPKKRKSIPTFAVILMAVLVLLLAFVYGYNTLERRKIEQQLSLTPSVSPSPIPTKTPTPTPTQKVSLFSDPLVQEAYNNTITTRSMRVGFLSDVKTNILSEESGETEHIEAKIEGYFLGNTDGNTIQTELRITQNGSDRTAFFGQILVNNQLFIKRNEDRWVERDRSDFNKLYENQPIDATAYAYNMVDTLFTNSKALLRAIDENTVQPLPDETIDDKPVKVFTFQFSNIDYINALQFDENTKEFTLEDAKKILVNAGINGKIYIDPETKTIIRIELAGTNFTQIAKDEAVQLGIITTHDITLVANLLDFNKPVSLEPPQ